MGNDCCPRTARAGTGTGCDGVVVAASAGSMSKNFLAQLGKNFCNFVQDLTLPCLKARGFLIRRIDLPMQNYFNIGSGQFSTSVRI
jgi:hypothetical protein